MLDKQNIETIYSLAPLQQMFLWHSLQTSSQAGLLHIRCDLEGAINPNLLHEAWQQVIRRHTALRTSVHWENIKQPLQVVARKVDIPWQVLDWREQPEPEQALEDWLEADRDRGFDLTQAPIMRLTLIRLGEQTYQQIWSCHHLMLDGWSGALVLNQVLEVYEAISQGQELHLPPAPSYQKYIQWLKQQDDAAAEAFWQDQLQGLSHPTPLPFQSSPAQPSPEQPASDHTTISVSTQLSVRETQALQDFLRSHRLTLSSLIQGIWAILLSSYSQTSDVVFGITVSGRQGGLEGVEAIAGLLINVLPTRVQISPNTTLLQSLETIQEQQRQIAQYAHSAPSQIQAWSPLSQQLFDSLLVIENYPLKSKTANETLSVSNIHSGTVSNYDLTILIKPGAALELSLISKNQVLQSDLDCLLEKLQTLVHLVQTHSADAIKSVMAQAGLNAPRSAVQSNSQPKPSQTDFKPKQQVAQSRQIAPQENALLGHISPRQSLEIQLQAIWKKLFNIAELDIDDNFFELGGNSLLAAQLFAQVQATFGQTLPLALLFQAPTIRTLVNKLLAQSDWSPSWASLVPIQPLGSKTPLFFIHPVGGNVLYYKGIANYLGSEQPFYGLQSQGLDGESQPYETIEEMAAHYIQEIQKIQPNGPYLMGGFCMGGTVAFEMARQLDQQGEKTELLALLDPAHSLHQIDMHPPHAKASGKDLDYYVQFMQYLIKTKTFRSFMNDKFKRTINDVILLIKLRGKSKIISDEEQVFQQISKMNEIALEKYHLSFLSGEITYLQSSDYAKSVIGSIVKRKYFESSEIQNYRIVATSHHQTITDEAHLTAWMIPLEKDLKSAQDRIQQQNKRQSVLAISQNLGTKK